MLNADNFKLATLPLAVTAAGPIGTAALTVDVASSFNVTYTGVAGGVITVPVPTDPMAGDLVKVSNVGTTAFTLGGDTLLSGFTTYLHWTGTAWSFTDGGRNAGQPVDVAAIPPGVLTVTHNLGMAPGTFSHVTVQVLNKKDRIVTYARNRVADTANTMSFIVPPGITVTELPHTFMFTPLS